VTKENASATTPPRQAGVEITPAMIEAGALTLASYYGEEGEPMDNLRRAAEAVFEAMLLVRPVS
jgi:hypothetical protein